MSLEAQRRYIARHPDRFAASRQKQNQRRKELRAMQPVRQESKSYFPHITKGITTAERIKWCELRVEEAKDRLAEQSGTIYETLWRAVLESRQAELARLQRVQS